MRYIVLFILMSISVLTLSAQPPRMGGGFGGGMDHGRVGVPPRHGDMNPFFRPIDKIDQLGEKSLEVYVDIVAKHLDLSSKTKKEFEKTYRAYYNEMSNIPKTMILLDNDMSEEQLEEQIVQGFNNADYSTAIKRKYYLEFKRILSVRQILMMYDVEREFLERINIETRRRQGELMP